MARRLPLRRDREGRGTPRPPLSQRFRRDKKIPKPPSARKYAILWDSQLESAQWWAQWLSGGSRHRLPQPPCSQSRPRKKPRDRTTPPPPSSPPPTRHV